MESSADKWHLKLWGRWAHQGVGINGKEVHWVSLSFLHYVEVRETRERSIETEMEQPERWADRQVREESWEATGKRTWSWGQWSNVPKAADRSVRWHGELIRGHSDRDVITVFDKNVFSGVMGAKTSTGDSGEKNSRDLCKCRKFLWKLCSEMKARNGALAEGGSNIKRDFFF